MRIGWLAALSLLFGCQAGNSFGCSEDGQCESAGITGMCEANGYCSFLDDTCSSGRRYGDLAGGGLAGVCVQEGPGSTGVVSTTNAQGSTSTGGTSEVPAASSSSSTTSETTGDFSCAPSGVCTESPLPGWSGPVVLEPAGPTACDGELPTWTAGTGLIPESACDCDCEGESEALGSCEFAGYDSPSCSGLDLTINASLGDCTPASSFSGIESLHSFSGKETIGCTSPPPLPAALDQVFAACEPTALGTCEDGTACIQEPTNGSVCNWRSGVHDCPSPEDQRTILSRDATGSYDCGCQCEASSACGSLNVYFDADCTSAPIEFPVAAFPECTNVEAGLVMEGVQLQVPAAVCGDAGSRNTPEPLLLDQEPTEVDPVTLCCR